MKNRGRALLIIAIVLGCLAIIILGVGFYLYNFHVFKEVRLCLGEPTDTNFSCAMVQDCLNRAEELQTEYNISELPEFAREKLEMLSEDAVFCDGTCKIREVRGINLKTYELENLEYCDDDEKEVLIQIKGKDGLKIWSYVKSLERV